MLWQPLIIILFFLLDISLFSFFGYPYSHLVLCYYSIRILQSPPGISVYFMALLLSLESFFYYGQFGMPLIYLIPISLVGRRLNTFISLRYTCLIFMLISCLISQILLEFYSMAISYSYPYTIGKICANILLIVIISLIERAVQSAQKDITEKSR